MCNAQFLYTPCPSLSPKDWGDLLCPLHFVSAVYTWLDSFPPPAIIDGLSSSDLDLTTGLDLNRTLVGMHVHTHARTHACTHTHAHKHTHTHACMHVHTLTHTQTHAHPHSRMHACAHTHMYHLSIAVYSYKIYIDI